MPYLPTAVLISLFFITPINPATAQNELEQTSLDKTKQSIELELQKAAEAGKAKTEEKKEEDKPLFTIETKEPTPSDITYETAQNQINQSLENLIASMTAVFPGIAPYDYQKKAEKAIKGESQINLTELVPGDFQGAKILLDQTKDYSLNKAQAINSSLKINNKITELMSQGFVEISNPKSKITIADIKELLKHQTDEVNNINIEKMGNKQKTRLAYASVQIYTLLLENVINSFYTQQELIKAATKEELGIFNKNAYISDNQNDKKLAVDLVFLTSDFNYVLDTLGHYVSKDKEKTLFSSNEQNLNYLYSDLRNLNVDLNIIKTKLYLYETANLFNFINTFPLVQRSLKIKEIYFSQDAIGENLKTAMYQIKNIYAAKTFSEKITTIRTLWNDITSIHNQIHFITAKSILDLIAGEFSPSGYFSKNFKYMTLFNYIHDRVEKIALLNQNYPSLNISNYFNKEDIIININLDNKRIDLSVALTEENIANPFLQYMANYRFEVSAADSSQSNTKTVTLKIGSYQPNNKFTGIEIEKTSNRDKQGFVIGFDPLHKEGQTTIVKKKNGDAIEAEKQTFREEAAIIYKVISRFISDQDGTSYVDFAKKTIKGNGVITIEKENTLTKEASKEVLTYKDSLLQKTSH